MNVTRSLLTLMPLVLLSNAACGGGSDAPNSLTTPTSATPTTTITVSQAGGLQGGSLLTFSTQPENFESGAALTYRWEFGDGETSSDSAPAHVYMSEGTHTVVLTVISVRQSARAEMALTVYGVTGTWVSTGGTVTMQLTQSGSAITGQSSKQNGPGELPYSRCAISGSVQRGTAATPSRILLSQPPCPHAVFRPLVAYDYSLGLVVGGQAIGGSINAPAVPGSTSQITLQRQ